MLIRAKRGENFSFIRAKRGENFLKYLFRAKRREFFLLIRAKRGENFLLIRAKRGEFLFRKSQKFSDQLPYVKAFISLLKFAFFRLWGARSKKAAGQTCNQRSAGAYRGAGLSFYVEEGRATHANPELGWRL